MKNDDVGFYIRKLSNHVHKFSHSLYNRKETNECSLSNLWAINFIMDSDEDVYQKDLEAEFSINRATASKMLTLMEEKKFISRTPSSEDGRLKKITVLPEGMKMKNICLSIKTEIEQELTADLTKEEIKFLKKTLKKMIAHFEK